jgi:hypothetical protein
VNGWSSGSHVDVVTGDAAGRKRGSDAEEQWSDGEVEC